MVGHVRDLVDWLNWHGAKLSPTTFEKDALKVAIDNHLNEHTIWTVAKRVLEPSSMWYYLQFTKQFCYLQKVN